MAVITDPDLLKELKKISEERCYKVYNKIVTTDYPSDPRFIDLSGRDIGYIHVNKYCGKDIYHNMYYYCICNYCGFPTIMTADSLNSKTTKTCGCFKYHHNKVYTRLYKIYRGMIERCYYTSCNHYQEYGGRGIKICDEWLNKENGFKSFYNWSVENGYQDNLSIDRINNNGNYCPENCRWVNIKVQSNNRSTCTYIKYKNYIFNIGQWSEITGLPRSTILNRLDRGWNADDALRTQSGAWYAKGLNKFEIIIPKEYEEYNTYDEYIKYNNLNIKYSDD